MNEVYITISTISISKFYMVEFTFDVSFDTKVYRTAE